MKNTKTKIKHQPVLLTQTLELLSPIKGESYLDLTAGYGGHVKAVLEQTKTPSSVVLVDRDPSAIDSLSQVFTNGERILQSDYESACKRLINEGELFDCILADIGVSSPHLDIASRGFSINQDGPLDMRMDTAQSLTAAEVVNNYKEDALVKILREYGEEPKARSIARAITNARPIHTTSRLAKIVSAAWRGKPSKSHPATRTFQALRIEVNDELGQLKRSLPLILKLLKPKGRMAVISFHSLEDRIVKNFFAERSGNRYDAELKLLTKGPAQADTKEIVFNPRARSAKLRAAVKIKN